MILPFLSIAKVVWKYSLVFTQGCMPSLPSQVQDIEQLFCCLDSKSMFAVFMAIFLNRSRGKKLSITIGALFGAVLFVLDVEGARGLSDSFSFESMNIPRYFVQHLYRRTIPSIFISRSKSSFLFSLK